MKSSRREGEETSRHGLRPDETSSGRAEDETSTHGLRPDGTSTQGLRPERDGLRSERDGQRPDPEHRGPAGLEEGLDEALDRLLNEEAALPMYCQEAMTRAMESMATRTWMMQIPMRN